MTPKLCNRICIAAAVFAYCFALPVICTYGGFW